MFFKFCLGVCFHLPSRIYTSSLLGCVHYAASVEVWSCCTTILSCATAVHCPGRVSSIPPRDPTALSATTRTPKSVVGEHSNVKVHSSFCGLHFDRTLVTWQLFILVKYLDQIQDSVAFRKHFLMKCILNNIHGYCCMVNVCN